MVKFAEDRSGTGSFLERLLEADGCGGPRLGRVASDVAYGSRLAELWGDKSTARGLPARRPKDRRRRFEDAPAGTGVAECSFDPSRTT